MQRMMTNIAAFAACTVLATAYCPTAFAADNDAMTTTDWVVDYRGKPPFKRQLVTTTYAAKDTAINKAPVVVRVGAPGKSRLYQRDVTLNEPVVRLARFEEVTNEQNRKPRRRGAPGKRNRALKH